MYLFCLRLRSKVEMLAIDESHICEEVDVLFSFYERYLNQCVDLCTMERFLQFSEFCFLNASLDEEDSAPKFAQLM